jgi:hypothetical protein
MIIALMKYGKSSNANDLVVLLFEGLLKIMKTEISKREDLEFHKLFIHSMEVNRY